jgi:hypothetical protein
VTSIGAAAIVGHMSPRTQAVVVVGPTIRASVRALVEARSVDYVAQTLGVSRAAVLRVLGGVGVRRGTALQVETALKNLNGATDPEAA